MPTFPKMFFVVADGGQKFDYTNQATMGKMNEQNIKLLKQIFGNDDKTDKFFTFDVINAQFMIHYLLKNTNTWSNFCSNVNRYLRTDGYLLITTLDGDIVVIYSSKPFSLVLSYTVNILFVSGLRSNCT